MKTVLIIDDDEICRTPAATLLKRDGWKVIEAADGEQGIALALAHRPDVILCDLLMPRGNGFHVCRTVREHPELAQTKLVVMTGRDYASDRENAKEAGVDDYLVKPIEFEILRAVLHRLASGSAAVARPVAESARTVCAEAVPEPAAGPVEQGM